MQNFSKKIGIDMSTFSFSSIQNGFLSTDLLQRNLRGHGRTGVDLVIRQMGPEVQEKFSLALLSEVKGGHFDFFLLISSFKISLVNLRFGGGFGYWAVLYHSISEISRRKFLF